MKRILIRADSPGGNISLLEQQLSEAMKKYLSSDNKICFVKPYEGLPMKLSEVNDKSDANYLLEIRVKEK